VVRRTDRDIIGTAQAHGHRRRRLQVNAIGHQRAGKRVDLRSDTFTRSAIVGSSGSALRTPQRQAAVSTSAASMRNCFGLVPRTL
jgi:hypothetical protein